MSSPLSSPKTLFAIPLLLLLVAVVWQLKPPTPTHKSQPVAQDLAAPALASPESAQVPHPLGATPNSVTPAVNRPPVPSTGQAPVRAPSSNSPNSEFAALAKAYAAPFKARTPRASLPLVEEETRERFMKIIFNDYGCAHPSNKQECEQRFGRLKAQADAGNPAAIRQYGISKFLDAEPVQNRRKEVRRALFEEGKDYLLKIAPQLSGEDASRIASSSARFDSPEEFMAWELIANRLDPKQSIAISCETLHIECTPELFYKAKDRAQAYLDLYQIDP